MTLCAGSTRLEAHRSASLRDLARRGAARQSMTIACDHSIDDCSERRKSPPTDNPTDNRPRQRAPTQGMCNCHMTAHRFATRHIDALQRGAAVCTRQPERCKVEVLPGTNRNRRLDAR